MSKFIKVAKVPDVGLNQKVLVEYDDDEVGLINLDNAIYAISNICTHDDGPLLDGDLDGDCIVCPRHGARFNLKTGTFTMPAMAPIPQYEVKIEGEDIYIAPLD
jgi:3-phenylpropionate/trans-cinnamate dioxygenase ferredoxin subunit